MAPIVRPPCNPAGRQAQVCRGRTGESGDGQEARLGRRAELLKPLTGLVAPFERPPEPQPGASLFGSQLPLLRRARAGTPRVGGSGESGVSPAPAGSLWPKSGKARGDVDLAKRHAPAARRAECLREKPAAAQRTPSGVFSAPESALADSGARDKKKPTTTSASPCALAGSGGPRPRTGARSFSRPCRARRRRGTSTPRRRGCGRGSARPRPGRGG